MMAYWLIAGMVGWLATPVPLFSQSDAVRPPIVAPYQVESIERTMGLYDTLPTDVVVISLSRARGRDDPEAGIPMPNDEDLARMTILGPRGFIHAYREGIERRCEHLCADEFEECHWVGLYRPEAPIESIGVMVAALPGRLDLADYTGSTALRSSPDPLASVAVSDSSAALLWGPWDGTEARLRVSDWDAESGAFVGEARVGSHTSPLAGDGCRSTPHDRLLEVDCGSFATLASGGRVLLLSWADYNLPKVEPLARFVYNGSRHYVVRFGAKAQDVVGLVSAEPAGWRARFRPRDWALLC